MDETADSSILKNLEELINCRRYLILEEEDQIVSLYEDLRLLRIFLKDLGKKFDGHKDVKILEARIRAVEYEAENTVDIFVVNTALKQQQEEEEQKKVMMRMKKMMMIKRKKIGHDHLLNLGHVKQEIEAIKQGVMEIYDDDDDDDEIDDAGPTSVENSSIGDSSMASTHTWEEEIIVGLGEEATIIKEQLAGEEKQLEVVSIVGMAGIGKTTLARKVYNDPLILYHFDIQAWISVSQEYRKTDLLCCLLIAVMQQTNGIDQMSDEELAQKLYKRLKGRRYLIVMDDIWDRKAWFDLKSCFPNDKNGSRIMFTSRHEDMALLPKPSSTPSLPLRFLEYDESWVLFERKVFGRRKCPSRLRRIGGQIVKKCRGLPLAIVVVAGILKNERGSRKQWKRVGETLDAHMADDSQLWMKSLALSYDHLPHHLKPCFLYFAAFPEDYQVPVRMLIWLWVAEGFISKTSEKNLEDIAEEYLKELVSRNLILVSKRGYDSGMKACGIHDLLRDFCIRKAEKERFLVRYSHGKQVFSSSNTEQPSIEEPQHAWTSLIIFPKATHTFLCFNPRSQLPYFYCPCYTLIRVLEASHRMLRSYPRDIEKLVHLRYLALGTLHDYSQTHLPTSLANLQYLETLIIDAQSSVTLPHCIRKMAKLRHIRLTGTGIHKIEEQDPDARYPFSLDALQTLSRVDPSSCGDFLLGTPNLRKLGFQGHVVKEGCLKFPDLDFLNRLQELKLFNRGFPSPLSVNLGGIRLPTNLKRLTLSRTYLHWDEMSTLAKLLPNLELLKLLQDACIGPSWETSWEFHHLKFLKFESLEIVRWNASSDHFPRLEQLKMVGCYRLKKIPSEMGDIPTLQTIEVHFCNPSLANSASKIKEEQESMGNYFLQVAESYSYL